jgi:hypothetical protein
MNRQLKAESRLKPRHLKKVFTKPKRPTGINEKTFWASEMECIEKEAYAGYC